MTPEKLRDYANLIECKGALSAKETAEHYRAHAAALEEIERLKGLLAAAAKELPHCSGPVHERIAVYRREHAKQIEQAERRAERLKDHAEAMAEYLKPDDGYERCGCKCNVCNMLAAYRAEFKGE